MQLPSYKQLFMYTVGKATWYNNLLLLIGHAATSIGTSNVANVHHLKLRTVQYWCLRFKRNEVPVPRIVNYHTKFSTNEILQIEYFIQKFVTQENHLVNRSQLLSFVRHETSLNVSLFDIMKIFKRCVV